MAKVKGEIIVDVERCKGCQVCIAMCKENAIGMSRKLNKKGYHFVHTVNDTCTGCINCAIVCPDGAITVYRARLN